MKTIYQINKVLIIKNIVLVPITILLIQYVFTGNLFFIPLAFELLLILLTGIAQVIMYIIYLLKWREIYDRLKIPFIIYGIVTAFILITYSSDLSWFNSDIPRFTLFVTGILLAFYFLFLSKKQYDFSKTNKLLLTE